MKENLKMQEKSKLTIIFFSYLHKINESYYFKIQIPIAVRHFHRIISQNTENLEKYCNDIKNPFHFACQKFVSEMSS